jgi:hypothetical protein
MISRPDFERDRRGFPHARNISLCYDCRGRRRPERGCLDGRRSRSRRLVQTSLSNNHLARGSIRGLACVPFSWILFAALEGRVSAKDLIAVAFAWPRTFVGICRNWRQDAFVCSKGRKRVGETYSTELALFAMRHHNCFVKSRDFVAAALQNRRRDCGQ